MKTINENRSVKYIYTAVGVASTTDVILTFLFPVILLKYYNLSVHKVTIIFTTIKICIPLLAFYIGYLSDKISKKIIILATYLLALFIPLLLLGAYYYRENPNIFEISMIIGLLNALVFSMTMSQETYIAENSREPQSSITKMFYVANFCLLVGCVLLTWYSLSYGNIVLLLIIKLSTDLIAAAFIIRAVTIKDSEGFPLTDLYKKEGAEAITLYKILPYAINALLLSAILAFGGYYLEYFIPLHINQQFKVFGLVTATYIFITAAGFFVNLYISRKKNNMSAGGLYIALAVFAVMALVPAGFNMNILYYIAWSAIVAVIFAFLSAYSRLNMVIHTPILMRGRVRGLLQTFQGILTGGFAYLFMVLFGNEEKRVGITITISIIAITFIYLAITRNNEKKAGQVVEGRAES